MNATGGRVARLRVLDTVDTSMGWSSRKPSAAALPTAPLELAPLSNGGGASIVSGTWRRGLTTVGALVPRPGLRGELPSASSETSAGGAPRPIAAPTELWFLSRGGGGAEGEGMGTGERIMRSPKPPQL